MAFSRGDYKKDSLDHRGWFVGTFIENGAAKTGDVEIKYWKFPVGPTKHSTKVSSIFECTIVLNGKIRGIINSEEIVLSAGEYIAIEPHTPNNLVLEILESAEGFTIKAPSDPSAKKVI